MAQERCLTAVRDPNRERPTIATLLDRVHMHAARNRFSAAPVLSAWALTGDWIK